MIAGIIVAVATLLNCASGTYIVNKEPIAGKDGYVFVMVYDSLGHLELMKKGLEDKFTDEKLCHEIDSN